MEQCRRRIDTKRAPAEVKTEFEGLKIRIKETESRLGDGEELRRKLRKRQKEFASLSREYGPLNSLLQVLDFHNLIIDFLKYGCRKKVENIMKLCIAGRS